MTYVPQRISKDPIKNLQQIAAMFGDNSEITQLVEAITPEEVITEREKKARTDRNTKHTISREAEAVLAYSEKSEYFLRKSCKKCRGPFATTYGNVAFCSDYCRMKALEDLGIEWDPSKPPQERWRPKELSQPTALRHHPVPLVVPSEVMDLVDSLLLHQSDNNVAPENLPQSLLPVDVAALLDELGL